MYIYKGCIESIVEKLIPVIYCAHKSFNLAIRCLKDLVSSVILNVSVLGFQGICLLFFKIKVFDKRVKNCSGAADSDCI